jgi:DNA-binding FadR family transcriptional regulator
VQEALRREGLAEPLLHDLYEFRLLIEPQAAAWMAEHGSDDDLARLDEITTTIDRLAGGDAAVAELMGADRDFHDLVARASQNRIVAAVSRDIREVLGTLWGLSALGADQARIVAGQHRAIADAIGRRDADEAAAAMRRHLQWAEDADLQGQPESRLDRVIRS